MREVLLGLLYFLGVLIVLMAIGAFYDILTMGTSLRPVKVLTKPELLSGEPLEQLEAEAFASLAPLIAEAERKAIAMHCPLKGDPHQARVTSLSPIEARGGFPIQLGGGAGGSSTINVAHLGYNSIEVTAFGDRERSYVPGPSPGYDRGRLQALQERRQWVLGQIWTLATLDIARKNHRFTPAQMAEREILYAELKDIDRRIYEIRRNAT